MAFIVYACSTFLPTRRDVDATTLAAIVHVSPAFRVVLAPNILHHTFHAQGCSGKLLLRLLDVETAVFTPRARLKLDDTLIYGLLLPHADVLCSRLPFMQKLAFIQTIQGVDLQKMAETFRKQLQAAKPSPPAQQQQQQQQEQDLVPLFDAAFDPADDLPKFSFEDHILEPVLAALSPRLEAFEFSASPCLFTGDSAARLCAMLPGHLTSLQLNGCALRTVDFSTLPQSLRCLSLRNNQLGGHLEGTSFARLQRLEELDISANRFVGSLEFMAHLPKSLRTLDASYTWLSADFSAALAPAPGASSVQQQQHVFLPQLKTLKINNCNLSGNPGRGLAALRECCPHIVELHLHNNDFSGDMSSLSAPAALVAPSSVRLHRMLPESLKRLSLYGNRLSGVFPTQFLLNPHTDVEELTVTNNAFSHVSEDIFFSLPPRLRLLSFDRNHFGNDTLPRLCFSCSNINRTNTTETVAHSLRFLYLGDCNFKGVLDVRGMKEKFPILDSFHVNGNQLTALIVGATLGESFPDTLRYFDASNNNICRIVSGVDIPSNDMERKKQHQQFSASSDDAKSKVGDEEKNGDGSSSNNNSSVLDLSNLPRQIISLNLAGNKIGGTLRLGSDIASLTQLSIINFAVNRLTRLEVVNNDNNNDNNKSEQPPTFDTLYLNDNPALECVRSGAAGGESSALRLAALPSLKRLDLSNTRVRCSGFADIKQRFVYVNFGARNDTAQREEMLSVLRGNPEDFRFPSVSWQALGISEDEFSGDSTK